MVKREVVSISELKEDRDKRIELLRVEISQLTSRVNLAEEQNSTYEIDNTQMKQKIAELAELLSTT